MIAAVLLAVAGASGAAAAQAPKRGGTLVVGGTLREPGCLNAFLARCDSHIPPVGRIMGLVFRGAFIVAPNLEYRPELIAGAEYTTSPPYTLTYHIRREARWSDGVPVTARDFVFTHNAIRSVLDEMWEPDSAYHSVVRSARAMNQRTVRVVLRFRFSGWRGLFPYVLPAHALQGEDFSTVFLDALASPKTGRPIGSGPFLVSGWERGRSLTFVRNPRYWKRAAYLDRMVLRFCQLCANGAEQVELLRRGEVGLTRSISLTGQHVQELRSMSGVKVTARPGASWEHIEIRIGSGGNPSLKRKRVRQALTFGIDRVALARRLYGSVRPDYPPSDSVIYLYGGRHYRQNWNSYRFDPERARRLLEQDGCGRGSDGIYVCDGRRLSFRLATLSGDPRRQQTLEDVQRQLRQAGIEILPVYAPQGTLFNQIIPSGSFDLAMSSYLGGPDGPGNSFELYGCGGAQNYSGYCQRLVSRDLDQARRILDADRQARVLNRVDAQLARDVPMIPLYQHPVVSASSEVVRNVDLGAYWDPFGGAEDWWLDR